MTQTNYNGGPAFPIETTATPWAEGMSMRDYFATTMDRDEYGEQAFRHLSQDAKCILAGPRPEKPDDKATREDRVSWQIADMEWELAVRAAIRFRYADAMIAAREGGAE